MISQRERKRESKRERERAREKEREREREQERKREREQERKREREQDFTVSHKGSHHLRSYVHAISIVERERVSERESE